MAEKKRDKDEQELPNALKELPKKKEETAVAPVASQEPSASEVVTEEPFKRFEEQLTRLAEREPAYERNEGRLSTHQWNVLASVELNCSMPCPEEMGLGSGMGAISVQEYVAGLLRSHAAGLLAQ